MPATFSGPAWTRQETISIGAPPKEDRYESAPPKPGTAALIRRNPKGTESRLLRKTRSFALHGYEQNTGNSGLPEPDFNRLVSEVGMVEVRTKPPREMKEISAEWLTMALRESQGLGKEDVVATMEGTGEVEYGVQQLALVEGSIGLQARLLLKYDKEGLDLPASMLLEMPGLGVKEHPALAEEERWYNAELVFLTECRPRAGLRVPRIFWAYANEPQAPAEVRYHWKWANARFPEHPWKMGEYCCLLEDLSEAPRYEDQKLEKEHVDDIVVALARLHAAFWEDESVLERICFQKSGVAGVDVSGVDDLIDGLLESNQLPPDDDQLPELMVSSVAMRTELQKEVATHGTTLIRGERGVGDWVQTDDGPCPLHWGNACVGSASYDLALFAAYSLSKEQHHEYLKPMLVLYYDTLIAGGVDGAVYSKEMLDEDFKASLWEVFVRVMLPAARELLALPSLNSGMGYRDKQRVMRTLAPLQATIAATVRILLASDAGDMIGMEEGESEDD